MSGELEISSNESLYVGHVDIKDAFWHTVRRYFTLPRACASYVGVSSVGGQAARGGTWLYPRMAALPMGFAIEVEGEVLLDG